MTLQFISGHAIFCSGQSYTILSIRFLLQTNKDGINGSVLSRICERTKYTQGSEAQLG